MSKVTNIISRAEAEVEAGRAWKAKEIISGSIFQWKYSEWEANPAILELYFHYGQLLSSLGDRMEAGKFMFLSAVRTEESSPLIALFTDRLKSPDPMNLYRALPRRARLNFISLYPPAVCEDFRSLGLAENLYEAARVSPTAAPEPTAEQRRRWRRQERWSLFGVFAIVVAPWLLGVGFVIWFLISSILKVFDT